MKAIKSLLLFISIFIADSIYSQVANHPTIDVVKAKYRSAPTSTNTSASLNFDVIPEITVELKTTTGVAKVYVKMIDQETNTIVYNINYNITSNAVFDSNGNKLFENNNGVLFISNGSVLILKPYLYEVYTENSQSSASPIYSSVQ